METTFKQLRAKLGLTNLQMAKALNLTSGQISLMETGKRNVTDRTIADLERLYRVNPDWLRTGEGEMFKEKTRELEIEEITANMFKSADNDIRYQLIKLVSQMSEEQLIAFKNIAQMIADSTKEDDEKIIKKE